MIPLPTNVFSLSCPSRLGIALVMGLALLVTSAASAADLVVELHNVKPRRGVVRAALFDNASDFQAAVKIRAMVRDGQISSGVYTREEDFKRDPAATIKMPAEGRTMTLRFGDLEPGEYALGVYQDLNADEKLDITLGGLSLEPWGISNDAGTLDADPLWENAKFQLPPEGLRIVVHLMSERRSGQQ